MQRARPCWGAVTPYTDPAKAYSAAQVSWVPAPLSWLLGNRTAPPITTMAGVRMRAHIPGTGLSQKPRRNKKSKSLLMHLAIKYLHSNI